MATKKISELEAINAAEDNDVLVIVDTSESTTNKITKGNLLIGAGHTIEMTLNENYQIVLVLKNAAGTTLSTQTIDLPNENAITNLAYNNGILTITKQSGATSQINLTGLIEGLVTESDFNTFVTAIKGIIGISTNTYDSTQTYNTGDIVVQSEKIYKANQDNITGTFDSSKWDEISLYEYQKIQDEAIAENYKVINKLNEKLENQQKVIDQLPQVEGQGTEVTLENTIEATFTKFDVEGNSVQDGTPSPDNEVPIKSAGDNENILPANNGSETIDGVNFTKNSDGTIIANGTAIAGINYYINGLDYENIPAGEYTLSDGVGTSGGESSNTFFTFLDGAPNSNSTISLPTFTLSQATNIRARIVIRSGVTLDNVVFKPKLEKGNKATPWSPYGMGSINEKISNKNLCKITDFSKAVANVQIKAENNILSFNGTTNNTISANDAIWKNIKLEVKEKGVYTPSLEKSITGVAFGYYKENSSTLISPYSELEVGSYTLGIYVPANTAFNNFTTGVQIEKGSATPYVEHEEQDYSIFVQQPFRSIGDVRDLFFKNTVDSPYYDENLTLNGWYERHYIGEVVLNGTENWNYESGRFVLNFLISALDISGRQKVYSNYFEYLPSGSADYGIFVYKASSTNSQIYIYDKDYTTVEEFKALLAEKYASGNPVCVNYILAEPLDLPCTETQIQQLENKPSTYKDFTIIQSQDETEAYLEVNGIYDLNKLITRTEVLESEV